MRPVLLSLALISIFTLSPQPTHAASCDILVGKNETHTTIDSALGSTNNLAGKTICVRNDKTYDRTIINKSGSKAAPLTITSHPNNNSFPVVRPSSPYPNSWQNRNDGKTAVVIKGNNIIFDGFEIAKSTSDGLDVTESENVIVRNVSIHETFEDGIRVLDSSHVTIENCQLYNNQLIGSRTSCLKESNNVCPVGEVLKLRRASHVTVQNCQISDDQSPGRGGVLNMGDRSSDLTVRNNTIYHNDGNNLHIGATENILVENNYVYSFCSDVGNGLYRLAERYPPDKGSPYVYKGKNITIRNNLIFGQRKGLDLGGCEARIERVKDPKTGKEVWEKQPWDSRDTCQLEDVTVENNTVVATGLMDVKQDRHDDKEYAFMIPGGQIRADNVKVRNNIFHSYNDKAGYKGDHQNNASGDFRFSDNIWSDNQEGISGNDQEIPGLTDVFASNPSLTRCSNSLPNPEIFKVANRYAGQGADVSKVGTQSELPPIPTTDPSTDPEPTDSPDPSQYDTDFNDDSATDLVDLTMFLQRFGKDRAKYDLNNNGPVDIFDFVIVVSSIL